MARVAQAVRGNDRWRTTVPALCYAFIAPFSSTDLYISDPAETAASRFPVLERDKTGRKSMSKQMNARAERAIKHFSQ